jgi:hypothetical protein
MADFDDVLTTLASIIDGVIYPNGDSQPSAVLVNASPVPARIYPGWPVSAALDADLLAGIINVSIFAPAGSEKNTTRFPTDAVVITEPVHTVTVAIDEAGTEITIGGTISTPQNVAIIANGKGVSYGVQAGDTIDDIASGLAALVSAIAPATASGPVISIPDAYALTARVGGAGTVGKPVGTQQRQFQITIWAPTPAARTAAAKLVDGALRDMPRITLPDTTMGMLCYSHTVTDDVVQKANCWRRDLFYVVEYTTLKESVATEIIVEKTIFTGPDPADTPIATIYN